MLELIWGILNISLLIYFFVICFKVIKLIRKNLGLLATLIFAFGILSFVSKPNNEKEVKQFKIIDQTKITDEEKISDHIFNEEIIIEDKLITKIHASITFKEYNQEFRLLNAYTYRNGFVSGIDWEAKEIDIDKINSNTYKYTISGKKDWNLLGIQIFSELKDYKGFLKL